MMTFCKALEVTRVDKPLKYFQLETIQLVLGCKSEVKSAGCVFICAVHPIVLEMCRESFDVSAALYCFWRS